VSLPEESNEWGGIHYFKGTATRIPDVPNKGGTPNVPKEVIFTLKGVELII
jgi:hypothetical protein